MAISAPTRISQICCFSSIDRRFQLQRRSIKLPTAIRKSFVVMSIDGSGMETTSSQDKTALRYSGEVSKPYVEGATKLHSARNENGEETTEVRDSVQEDAVGQPKRGAKIHDFCFGIPYGGLVLSGGLIGSMFSRNFSTLRTGLLFGGALLALSTFSLRIWRQGKSSLPFILGQAVLSAVLFWGNFTAYSLTKKLIPTGFYAAISAAMLCFYFYVVISGGNPPPKKLKSSVSVSS